ncbi:MAG: T9SS type A sorting domain-containing protein [Bacteroidales bacterium]|nr:T9SS type A sorting domain-containing protein [Bacteroidales bacterium]
MKPQKLFVCFFIFLLSARNNSSAQERIFTFANAGSESQLLWSDSDSLGFNYLVGRFNTSFEYLGNVVSGSTTAETGNNIYVLKVSATSKPVWLKSVRFTGENQWIGLIGADINENGQIAIALNVGNAEGLFAGERFIALDGSRNNQLIIKFSKAGFINWVKILNVNDIKNEISIRDIKIDDDGAVYAAGFFTGPDALIGLHTIPGLGNYQQMFVTKYSANGVNEWAESCEISPDIVDTIGGIAASKIALCPNGNILINGSYTGNRNFILAGQTLKNKGYTNSFLACFDPTGSQLWAKPYEGDGYILPGMLICDKYNNAIFACYYQSMLMTVNGRDFSSETNYDLVVSKYNHEGVSQWDNSLNLNLDFVSESDPPATACPGNDENIYIGGRYIASGGIISQYFLSYISETGNLNWIQLSENTSSLFFEKTTFDKQGNANFCGKTYSSFSLGGKTVESADGTGVSFFGKVLHNGNIEYIYSRNDDATNNNSLDFRWINTDIFDNIWLIGSFNGSDVQLDNIPVSEKYDKGVFISRYVPVTRLGGKVINLQGDAVVSGYVKLLGYSYYQKSPLADSVKIDMDGKFLFAKVPYGRYILLAVPGGDKENEYFPTYFPSVFHWVDAEKIEVKSPINLTSLYIFVPRKPLLTGHSKLSGTVTQTDENDVFKSATAKASPKAKAKLMKPKPKSDWEVVAETETDENGYFSFEGIADGEYSVIIEEAGLPVYNPYSVIISGGKYISNLDYLIDEEKITPIGEPHVSNINLPEENVNLKIYPNPSTGAFTVEFSGSGIINKIMVTDLQGRIVSAFYNVNENFNIENLGAGIYFLTVDTKYSKQVTKLIVTQ